MKRSLIASALLAGLVSLYAPASHAEPEAGLKSVVLSGSFSAGLNFTYKVVENYGTVVDHRYQYPVVGIYCPDEGTTATCQSGLLYQSNTASGYSIAGQSGGAILRLHGFLVRFDDGDYLGWSTNLQSNAVSSSRKGVTVNGWSVNYYSPNIGQINIGGGAALSAFTNLRSSYSDLADRFDVDDGSYMIFPAAAGDDIPFDYVAPGVVYSSPSWNGLAFAVSAGASIDQQRTIKDDHWENTVSNAISIRPGPGRYRPHAIQWSVAFMGYFSGFKGTFLDPLFKPFAGQWMLSYAQSKPLQNSQFDSFKMRRAAHVSFASVYPPLQSLNVIDFQWTQNTGLGTDGSFTKNLLEDLGVQSNFDGGITLALLGPLEQPQLFKPIPYWNAGVSWTTFHFGYPHSDMAWTIGYTRTQTYGYDYPGVQLDSVATTLNSQLGDFYSGVFESPELDKLSSLLGADPSLQGYPNIENQYGRLIAQTLNIGARYRYRSPYGAGRLSFSISGELVYSKASLQLQGTPEQLKLGYSTKPFDLGTDITSVLNIGLNYAF